MRLRPGFTLTQAIQTLERLLRELETDLANVYNSGWRRYPDWLASTERTLRGLFADSALADALYSERCWRILEFVGAMDRQHEPRYEAQATRLLESELRVQQERLQAALEDLRLFQPMADADPPAVPLVWDTNVLVHFDPFREELDQAAWCEIAQVPPGAGFRVVIPVLVLDELDRAAHSGDRRMNKRARAAQRHLQPFAEHLLTGKPQEIRRGVPWMTVEILPDAPGHRPRPDKDDELLDRAEFLHQLTGQRVLFLTADRGMQVDGQVRELLPAGFKVRMLPMPERRRVQD
jgi:PIN domain